MLERQFAANPAIEERRRKLSELGISGTSPTASPANLEGGMAGAFAQSNPNGTASAPPRPTIDAGLADIFEEFRMAAEDEHDLQGEDFETHYNMGLAYKEMDLLDEAVREFQTAVGLSMPKDGTARYLQCCNLLGHCFVQKGLPKAAVIWFRKGLDAPGHTVDEYQALRYELAAALEQLGDITQAIDAFTEVYSVDVSYRDVAEKLQVLQAKKAVVTNKQTQEA